MLIVSTSANAGTEILVETLKKQSVHHVVFEAFEDAYDAIIRCRSMAVWLDIESRCESLGFLQQILSLAPDQLVITFGGSSEDQQKALELGAFAALEGNLSHTRVDGLVKQARFLRTRENRRQQALEAAHKQTKFYRDMLHSVNEGILVFDDRGQLQFQNAEARRLLSEALFISESPEESDQGQVHKSVVSQVLQQIASTIAEHAEAQQNIVLEADQQRFELEVQTSHLRASDGGVRGAIAVLRDRSKVAQLEEQIAHSERLATLGGLLASIAHDIQNPLTCVTGCAEIGSFGATEALTAAEETADTAAKKALEQAAEDMSTLFTQIQEAGLRCQGIVNNLLAYSRQSQSQRRNCDLNACVRKTFEFVSRYRKLDNLVVDFALDENLPFASVNESEVSQALTNLIDNALQAMASVSERKLRFVSEQVEMQAVVKIIDSGPGMSAARLRRIWHPFYTTKTTGTGLGLHITKRVIENQNGKIDVSSTIGEGTCFTMILPLA